MPRLAEAGVRMVLCGECWRTIVLVPAARDKQTLTCCLACQAAGAGGAGGFDLPGFAIEWAEATGQALTAALCAAEAVAWEVEAASARRTGQPEVAVLATYRAEAMRAAAQALRAAREGGA